MEVDLSGIRLWPTEVEVNHQDSRGSAATTHRLRRRAAGQHVRRKIPEQKHEESRPAADEEVRQKVSPGPAHRRETSSHSSRRQGGCASAYGTDGSVGDRAHAGGRRDDPAAVHHAAAAGWPRSVGRPHAPAPGPRRQLASIQVHESALNNVLERLDLNGRTFTMPQLSQHVARTFNRSLPQDTNPDHQEVHIRFAKQDAVRVRCQGGSVEITLAMPACKARGNGPTSKCGPITARRSTAARWKWSATASCHSRPNIWPRADRSPCAAFLEGLRQTGTVEHHSRAAGDRSQAGRPGDYAVCDPGRLGGHGVGSAASDGAAVGLLRR